MKRTATENALKFPTDESKEAYWKYYFRSKTTGGSKHITTRQNTGTFGARLDGKKVTYLSMPNDVGYVQGRLREMLGDNGRETLLKNLKCDNPSALMKIAADSGYTCLYPYKYDGVPNSKFNNYKRNSERKLIRDSDFLLKVGDILVWSNGVVNGDKRGHCGIIESVEYKNGNPIATISESFYGGTFFTSQDIDPLSYANSKLVNAAERRNHEIRTDYYNRLISYGWWLMGLIRYPEAALSAEDTTYELTGALASDVYTLPNLVWGV